MKIIDAHTHFYPKFVAENPEVWAKRAREDFWGALVGKREDGKLSLQGFPTEEKFLEDLRIAEVSRAIIQGWYWETSAACRMMNEAVADFSKRYPDKISAFACVNIADISDATDIVKHARKNGFCGIGELHDRVQKFDFNSEEFARFATLCADEDLPVCVHLSESGGRDYKGKVETDNEAAFKAAEKFKHTKFIFAHWGGSEIFKAISPLPNVFFDSAATPLQFRGDTSIWGKGISLFPDNCIFGSDYPIRLYPRKFRQEELFTIVSEALENTPVCHSEKFFHKNLESLIKF